MTGSAMEPNLTQHTSPEAIILQRMMGDPCKNRHMKTMKEVIKTSI
jgi:hypothetical protein